MVMAEAGLASGAVVQRTRNTTHVIFLAASEQREDDTIGKRLHNKTSEPESALVAWRCRME